MGAELEFRTEPTVKLIDSMGDDGRIAWAARGSTGGGNVNAERDNALVGTLIKESHLVPLEHCTMTWEIEMSVTVARQLVKTRTSSWSELSGRYRELHPVFYLPHETRLVGQIGKPMEYNMIPLDLDTRLEMEQTIRDACRNAWADYQHMLSIGITREVARAILPECRGTVVRWTMNLVTALRLMQLRVDWREIVCENAYVANPSHPQDDTQRVALLMWDELNIRWPAACAAFRENGYSL